MSEYLLASMSAVLSSSDKCVAVRDRMYVHSNCILWASNSLTVRWPHSSFGYLQGREAEYTYHFIERDVEELAAAVHKAKMAGVSSEQDILKVTCMAVYIVCDCETT